MEQPFLVHVNAEVNTAANPLVAARWTILNRVKAITGTQGMHYYENLVCIRFLLQARPEHCSWSLVLLV